MRVVGIPARYFSSRFPGKLLAPLGGKPVIRWVVEAALRSQVDRVVVATDDERIGQAVSDLCEVILTPSDLPSGSDRLAYALGDLPEDTVVANVQGDEPFVKPSLIDTLFRMAEEKDAHIYTLAYPSNDGRDPNRVKVVINRKNEALYFSRQPIPHGTREFLIHIGMYAYRLRDLKEFLNLPPSPLETSEKLEQLRPLYHGWKIKVAIVPYEGFGIDTPEDLKRANATFHP
ncbi:MAG: 3-deoxy-manno-octulosonate cytidylyltransferase [Thermotogae bacterium]|nr:3-deoxy-manno-octulosonate cytidylyltransferase [Thermotogota bacterium]